MIGKTWPQEANAPLIYVIFLGGAADKESFLWGNINLPFGDCWPHKTMYRIARQFNYDLLRELKCRRTITRDLVARYYRFAYLSYAEVCFWEAKDYDPRTGNKPQINTPAFKTLLQSLCPETHIYIIGHSLGAWNGAHLSALLAAHGYKSAFLVTLDPVGMGNHELDWAANLMKQAQIYSQPPMPVTHQWINVRGFHVGLNEKRFSDTFGDWVAWAGGQWLVDQNHFTGMLIANELTDIPHRDAEGMFGYPTQLGYSAYHAVINSILDVIECHIPT